MATTHLNVGCGVWRADPPWLNIDVESNDHVHPDLVVPRGKPIADQFSNLEKVYLGHLLEHVWWKDVIPFLHDITAALRPGGQVLVVGPDVYRILTGVLQGAEPVWLLKGALESADTPQESLGDWEEASHKWNCHEERLVEIMTAAGLDVKPLPIVEHHLFEGWPLGDRFAPWQCAALGTTPI